MSGTIRTCRPYQGRTRSSRSWSKAERRAARTARTGGNRAARTVPILPWKRYHVPPRIKAVSVSLSWMINLKSINRSPSEVTRTAVKLPRRIGDCAWPLSVLARGDASTWQRWISRRRSAACRRRSLVEARVRPADGGGGNRTGRWARYLERRDNFE